MNVLKEDSIEIPVQVNGKLRGRIVVSATAADVTIKHIAMSDEQIAPLLDGKTVRKVVIVPAKLVNIIVT